MKYREAEKIVAAISYKEGWRLKLSRNRWPSQQMTLEISFESVCSNDGKPCEPTGRYIHELPRKNTTEVDIIVWVRDKILESERHEMTEWFKYRGKRIFDEHYISNRN